jgi:trimethylamine---corrinoid protein Co-methyltransferase
VGPAEHFLGEQHTLHHFRETWTSRFMDTSTWEAWEEAGRPEAPDHAREQARETLASHVAAPLEPEVAARIEEVIAEHVRDR